MYEDLRIYADNMRIDVKSDVFEADGNVRIVSLNVPETDETKTQPADDNSVRSDTTAIKTEIQRTRSGDTITIYGDYLQYDLNMLHGMVVQNHSTVQRVYFRGQDLVPSAPITNLKKGEYFDHVERSPVTSITAKKLRISPYSKYEAWKASIYVKDGKTMDLPYYTNDTGKVTPGNWRVRRIKYSSNDNFALGVGIRYNESKRKKGMLNLDYRDKGSNHFVLGLDQQIFLTKQIGGALNLSNLGGGDEAIDISLNRYQTGMRSQSLNMRYGRDGESNMNFNFGTKWGASSMRGFVMSNWSSKADTRSMNANFNVTPPTKYLDKKKKFSASFDANAGYTDFDPSEPMANAFVGVSLNRYGWRAGPKAKINTGINFGYSANTEGVRRATTGASVSYNMNFGKRGSFSLAYRATASSDSEGKPTRGQNITTSVGVGSSAKWNTRFGTSYDLTKNKFSMLNGTLDFTINKKCRLSATALYDIDKTKFTTNIYRINYKIDGSTINAQWYKESNDFILDFSNSFR